MFMGANYSTGAVFHATPVPVRAIGARRTTLLSGTMRNDNAQDVSDVSQSLPSDRTRQVEHWRCSRVPIVLANCRRRSMASFARKILRIPHCGSKTQLEMIGTNQIQFHTSVQLQVVSHVESQLCVRKQTCTLSHTLTLIA